MIVGGATARLGEASPRELLARYGILVILGLEILIWSLLSPAFLTESNMTNVARQAAVIGIVAVGMTFVILTAGIDLSVGSLLGFAGIVSAWAMQEVAAAGAFGVLVAVGVGTGSGLFVGFIVAKLEIPAFITTLAMLAILKSGTLLLNDGEPIGIDSELYRTLGTEQLGSIPVPVIVMAAAYLVGHWALSSTRFGRHVYAIGGNPQAARSAGIRVDRHLIAVYVITGALVGVGAVLAAGRLGTATPLTGDGLELDVIAAVIIGGTSLFGGIGTLWGTLAGVLIIAFLRNGLTLMDVSGFWQLFATGTAVLAAVLLDRWLRAGTLRLGGTR